MSETQYEYETSAPHSDWWPHRELTEGSITPEEWFSLYEKTIKERGLRLRRRVKSFEWEELSSPSETAQKQSLEEVKIRKEAIRHAVDALIFEGVTSEIEGYDHSYSMAHVKFLRDYAERLTKPGELRPIIEPAQLYNGRCPSCGHMASAQPRQTVEQAQNDVRAHIRIVHEGEK